MGETGNGGAQTAHPRLLSLYTGAGGLDLGFEAAGFEVAAAVEHDGPACQTVRANRNWNPIPRDIHDVPSQELTDASGAAPGEIDLLIGGPPCQPFSKSAYWVTGDTKRLDDPRADTLTAWLRVLRDLQPKAFLLENVAGLAYQKKAEGIRLLEDTVRAINRACGTSYSFQVQVLNAADYGVPQVRERAFVVGARDGTKFAFPRPTHFNPNGGSLPLEGAEPWLTAWDAIGDLNDDTDPDLAVTGKWANLLPSIPEGENYLYHTARKPGMNIFGWRTRYWSFLLKLAKDRPSWTIAAQPGSAIGPFHWKSRRLSMRELCRLQTFPDDYEVLGSRTEVQKQLGNAVPSALAEVLAREIRHQFLGGPKPEGMPSLIPKQRGLIPPPETIAPVPSEYIKLVGDHPEHPGEGKGPAAQRLATSAG